MLLSKNRKKGSVSNNVEKFSSVGSFGKNDGGIWMISFIGFMDETNIHIRGNIVIIAPSIRRIFRVR
jgi:hypothetical protein